MPNPALSSSGPIIGALGVFAVLALCWRARTGPLTALGALGDLTVPNGVKTTPGFYRPGPGSDVPPNAASPGRGAAEATANICASSGSCAGSAAA